MRRTGPGAAWLAVPVVLEPGESVGYAYHWEQARSAEDERGNVSWNTTLTLRAAEVEGRRTIIQLTETRGAEEPERQASFRIAPDGAIDAVKDFEIPSGYSVSFGGVKAMDLIDPATWLASHLRPLPGAALDEGQTWNFDVVFDGLPLPLRVRFEAAVESVSDDVVTVTAVGTLEEPRVDERARHVADWLRSARQQSEGRVQISRKDGLVRSLEFVLTLESDSKFQFGETEAPEPDGAVHRTQTTIRLDRR